MKYNHDFVCTYKMMENVENESDDSDDEDEVNLFEQEETQDDE